MGFRAKVFSNLEKFARNKSMTAYVSTGSSLSADTISAAFVESARILNDAESTRNSANPGVAPKNNVAMTADFDTRTLNITLNLPLIHSIDATSGKSVVEAQDYLGSTYSAFTVGTGEAKSTTKMGATLEIAQKLAAYEKLVQPETDQPNNIQISYDFEERIAAITATIPFTPSIGVDGVIQLTALDYV
jgi:hypothetical protein